MTTNLDDLYTYQRLADRWGRSLGGVYILRHEGRIAEPDLKVGQSALWTEATVERMEAADPKLNLRTKGTK